MALGVLAVMTRSIVEAHSAAFLRSISRRSAVVAPGVSWCLAREV
jgi:hypothetical protein